MDFWILAVSSAFLLGIWQFGLSVYRGRLSVYAIILISASTAALVYVAFGFMRSGLTFNTEDTTAGLIGGALNLTGTLLLLQAFARGKIGVAVGVGALYVLVPLGYSLLNGARPTSNVAIGVGLLLAGLVTFYAVHARPKDRDAGPKSRVSVLLASGTALFWGLAIIALDVGSRESVTSTLVVSQVPQIAITALVLVFASRQSTKGTSVKALAVLAASGVALALGNISFFTAAQEGNIAIVSVLGSANPLVTALLAAIFFKERLWRSDYVALVLVIVGAALVAA